MKKIIIAMAAIAAAFTTASCSKEQLAEAENNPTEGNCIITASTESNLTKTSLEGDDENGYEVVWSEGDTFKLGGNTFTLINGAGTTSGTFQGNVPGTNGFKTAFYPASYDGSNWPTKQTYTEGNITGSPMKADVYCYKGEISGGKVEFKNVGGILRLSVKGTAKVTSITVYTDNMPDITLDCGDGVDLNSTDGTVFHIAMPAGTYSGTSIVFSTDNGKYCIKTLKSNLVINRSEITPASIRIDNWSDITSAPDGALSGTFTVSSDGKKVFFSKGNLYWNNTSFQFESSQLSSASEWNASHVSHFYWSNDATKACAECYSDPDASQNDVFFTNATYTTPNPTFTANGQTGMWRTLSKDEWEYLLENNGSLWTTIDGVNGLIIFYDGYSGSRTGLTDIPKGCAFLPAAGSRNGYSGMISGAGSEGAYSSSVAGSSEGDPTPCAYDLVFGESYTTPQALNYRVRYGCSVRLVTEKSGSTPSFTVTFDMNGKTGTAPAAIDVPYHGTITKPNDPTVDGYTFWGWYKDKACTVEWDFANDLVTSNTILYARWHISGALSGTFTVNSSGKKVNFAKGNLWYGKTSEDAESATFNFEENQYGYSVKYDVRQRCLFRDEDHISHFMWSKNANVSLAVDYDDPSATLDDVFFTNATQTTPNPNFTVNGQKGVWRALSNEEAIYLFNHHGHVWATINGVGGIIVFCDGYSGETEGDFAEIPKDCLFLPAAGYRNGLISTSSDNTSMVYYCGNAGEYLTSTENGYDGKNWATSPVKKISFDSSYLSLDVCRTRSRAQSVRLVTDITE